MTIVIKNRGRILNEMTAQEWVDSCGDNECFEIMTGKIELEDSVARWNLDNQCKGSPIRAEVV